VLGAISGVGAPLWFYWVVTQERRKCEPLLRIPGTDLPDGEPFLVRADMIRTSRLLPGEVDGEIRMELIDPGVRAPFTTTRKRLPKKVVVGDAHARRVLRRGSVRLNQAGASSVQLQGAVDALERAGGTQEFVHTLAREGRTLIVDPTSASTEKRHRVLSRAEALALEIALGEDEERRALQGDLTVLEAAWREAEEIAALADRLALHPGDPTA
jgi:hypothetical protein